jgi:anti-sigma regulatory factor (Ser/Thr protein kinase)
MSADERLDGDDAIDLAERNRRIAAAYRAGETMTAIAARYVLSVERVRQLVRRAEGRQVGRKRSADGTGERVRLRIGNLAKAVLVTGQAYQDPKDALNEFVSNAADDYAEAGIVGGRIRVLLRRKGVRAVIAVDDAGRGMTPDRLREVARNLFESAKAGDDRTLGEKAIGLLAFQQLGGKCDVVSRAAGSDETWTLRLRRGEATADLVREKRRARDIPGTTVFVSELDAEVGRVLTQRKVVEYLRRRPGVPRHRLFGRADACANSGTRPPGRRRGNRRADGRRPAPSIRSCPPRARRPREPDAHVARRRAWRGRNRGQ